jgi:aminocarboxymuconate-semialdehyde decarboxylase
MGELGLRGAMIGSNVNGRNLDDPTLESFWAAAADLGALIFIHPHGGAAAERLGSYYLKNLVDCRSRPRSPPHRLLSAVYWNAIPD